MNRKSKNNGGFADPLGVESLNTKENVSRGAFIKGAAGVIAAAATGGLGAAESHEHHHNPKKYGSLIDITSDCIVSGEKCLSHCFELVKQKDTSIAGCLTTVSEMLVLCKGLIPLAVGESQHLAQYAKVCISTCESCIKECEKHADKHKECKECAELCQMCIDECKKIAA